MDEALDVLVRAAERREWSPARRTGSRCSEARCQILPYQSPTRDGRGLGDLADRRPRRRQTRHRHAVGRGVEPGGLRASWPSTGPSARPRRRSTARPSTGPSGASSRPSTSPRPRSRHFEDLRYGLLEMMRVFPQVRRRRLPDRARFRGGGRAAGPPAGWARSASAWSARRTT